jgi:uncharacterized protein (TIGR02996 family)
MTAALDAGTGAALLDDIIARPDDDGLRLIYADWLEDAGQHERAELIRVQIEQSRLIRRQPGARVGGLCKDTFRRYCTLDGRAEALIDVIVPLIELPPGMPDGVQLTWRRGLISRVRLPLAAWRECGPALVRAHPITRVDLSDREPGSYRSRDPFAFSWWVPSYGPGDNGRHQIPFEMAKFLGDVVSLGGGGSMGIRFAGKAEAVDALSDALIAWARLPDSRR